MARTGVSDSEALGDILRAAYDVGLPEDPRHLIVTRFLFPAMTEAEIGAQFDWTPRYLGKLSRSLEPDRRFGRALRQKLGIYKTNPKKVVGKTFQPAYDQDVTEQGAGN